MESMRSFWRSVKEKMEQDPHFIPVMGIEAENGKGAVEWIKFMDSLKEMDYVSVKDDLRDRISASYGVGKVFMADNTTSGGLNNEGMQILVTNRAVQMAQNVYNSYVFPFLIKQFGITDWNDGRLTYLSLANLNLDYIPSSISMLDSLETLFLNDNNLNELPNTLCDLPTSCDIYVQDNNLCEEYCISSGICVVYKGYIVSLMKLFYLGQGPREKNYLASLCT